MIKIRKFFRRARKVSQNQVFVGEYYDFLYFIKATQEFVKGFYDRAFGENQDEFFGLWEQDSELKEDLELIIPVLDKWLNDKYTTGLEDNKSHDELAEAFRILGKILPQMWD